MTDLGSPLRRSVAWYAVAQAGPGVAMLLAVPLWTRLVGASEYAHYATVWAVCVTAGAASTGWLRQAMLRASGRSDSQLSHLPLWSVVGSLAVPALACAAVSLGRGPGAVVAASAFGLTSAAAQVTATLLQRGDRARAVAFAETSRTVVGILLSVVLVQAVATTSTMILAACAAANVLVLAVLVLRSSGPVPRWSGSGAVLAEWWSYGWPMSLWLGLAPLLLYTDRLLLRFWVDDATLGAYAATSDLVVRGAAVVAAPLTMALTPAVMRASNAGGPVDDLMTGIGRWMLRLVVLFAGLLVLTLLVGTRLIDLLLDVESPSRSTLAGLLVGGAAWQIGLLAHKPLEIARRTRMMLGLLVAASAVALVPMPFLAARYGPPGVAWAMAAGACCYVLAAWSVGRRPGTADEGAWDHARG